MTAAVEVNQTESSQPGETVITPELTDKSKKHIIYARFDRKPPAREEIRLLNPAIIDVRFPRQKSAKFVFLEFENDEAASLALKELKKAHKKMTFKTLGKKKAHGKTPAEDASDPAEEESLTEATAQVPVNPKSLKCLHVTGLPLFATEEVLRSLFPKDSEIVVSKQNFKGKKQGFVSFSSAAEATEAFKTSAGVSVNGEPLTIALHKGNKGNSSAKK